MGNRLSRIGWRNPIYAILAVLMLAVGGEHLAVRCALDRSEVVDRCTHDDFDKRRGGWNGFALYCPEGTVCEGCSRHVCNQHLGRISGVGGGGAGRLLVGINVVSFEVFKGVCAKFQPSRRGAGYFNFRPSSANIVESTPSNARETGVATGDRQRAFHVRKGIVLYFCQEFQAVQDYVSSVPFKRILWDASHIGVRSRITLLVESLGQRLASVFAERLAGGGTCCRRFSCGRPVENRINVCDARLAVRFTLVVQLQAKDRRRTKTGRGREGAELV